MKNLPHTPSLRFPQFSGNWEIKKLGEVTNKINSGKTPLGGEAVYSEEGILFIRSQNINNDKLELENKTFIPEEVNSGMKNSIVKPNDILLNITGASLGRSCVVPNDFQIGNVNQHVCIIRFNSNYNPRFVQPIFSSEKGQNLFKTLQTGSGREGLNFENIKQIEISFPTLPEQEKIAGFLTVVDAKLQALKKKKALLEEYKKGIMQRIFSGQLRFKDAHGQSYPDWEVRKLGEVAEIKMGQSPDSKSYNDTHEGIPLIQGNADIVNRISQPRNWTTEITKTCNIGDLILTVRAPVGSIAKSNHYACIGRGVASIKNNSNSNQEYLYQFLINFEKNWKGIEQGSTFTSVSGLEIKNLNSPFPSLPEQEKIAKFLSAIDGKIAALQTQLDKTQEWKKGLLQGMFC